MILFYKLLYENTIENLEYIIRYQYIDMQITERNICNTY